MSSNHTTESMNQSLLSSVSVNTTEHKSIVYVAVVFFLLGLIDVTTLVGNCIVVIAVFSTKSLHTVTNMLIVSLAVADMLVAVFVLPLSIYTVVYNDWIFGHLTCDLWMGTDVLLCTASILNLCCISIDRYFAIIHPLKYTSQRSPKLARTMIGLTWILSFIISCPPVFGWKDKDRDQNTCSLNRLLSYRVYSSMGSFFLPATVMIFVYLRIFKTINDREKYLKSNTFNFVSTWSNRTGAAGAGGGERGRCTKVNKHQNISFKSKKNISSSLSDSNNHLENEIIDFKDNKNKIPIENNHQESPVEPEQEINSSDNHFNHLICCQKHRNSNFSNCSVNDIYLLKSTAINHNCASNRSLNQLNSQHNQVNNFQKNRQLKRAMPSNLVALKLATNSSDLDLNSPKKKRSLFKRSKQTKSEETNNNIYSSSQNINKLQPHHQPKSFSLINNRSKNSLANTNNPEQTRLARENKATKTLAIVVGCFILSWLPFFIMYVLEAILDKGAISNHVANAITWLGYFNSAINPFIYAFCSKQFRSAFYRVTFGVYKKEQSNNNNNKNKTINQNRTISIVNNHHRNNTYL